MTKGGDPYAPRTQGCNCIVLLSNSTRHLRVFLWEDPASGLLTPVDSTFTTALWETTKMALHYHRSEQQSSREMEEQAKGRKEKKCKWLAFSPNPHGRKWPSHPNSFNKHHYPNGQPTGWVLVLALAGEMAHLGWGK